MTCAIRECAKVRGEQQKLRQATCQMLSINLLFTLAAVLAVVLSVMVYGICLIVVKNEFTLDFLQPLLKKK